MLSLSELRRAAAVLDAQFSGHRVERWLQPDEDHLAVVLYGRDGAEPDAHEAPARSAGRKRSLLLCCRREHILALRGVTG